MMGWAVLTDESCAVETEHDGETQEGGIVYDIVIGSLGEG